MSGGGERRRSLRLSADDHAGIPLIRIRPGYSAAVVDISAGGALVETARGFSPGVRVEVQVDTGARRWLVRGWVLRCSIAQLHAAGVTYRSAIAFEQPLPWFAPAYGHVVPAVLAGEDRDERTRPAAGP